MNALRRTVLLPLLVVLPASLPATLRAQEVEKPDAPAAQADVKAAQMAPKFLRFVDDGAAGGKLETADVTYKNADGVTVCLVSAIHIGERSYFQGLNESFKKYDAVLYELVKPKDAEVPAPGAPPASGSGVGELQRMLKDTLNLEFQLDAVDYTPRNFVHADMDAETFEKMSVARGETMPMLMLKNLMRAMSEPEEAQKQLPQGDPEEQIKELVRIFTRPDSERRLKTMIARQMMDIELEAAGLGGENSVILTERNKAAMKVLEETLKQKDKRTIAVYYGAAHMPDLEKRMEALGFKPVATEWRLAWDLKIRADQPSAIEDLLIDAIDALMEPVPADVEEGEDGDLWTDARP